MKAAAAAHELRCRYKGKRCEHPRSTKSNGKLHLLCQKHRERANENQKRIDERKRSKKHTENDGMDDDKQEETGLQAHEDSGEHTEKTTRTPSESLEDKEDESIEFRDSVLDLDDTEIEELQALVVAEQLQEVEHESYRRIDT